MGNIEMTQDDIKKLSRLELIELMLNQGKEIDRLQEIVGTQEAQLADRKIKIDKCGTLAEATIALNKVMEAAQSAANQYLENAEEICRVQAENAERMAAETEQRCRLECETTQNRCTAMVDTTRERCDFMLEQAREECSMLRNQAREEIEQLKNRTEEECRSKKMVIDDTYLRLQSIEAEEMEAIHQKADNLLREAESKALKRMEEADAYYHQRLAGIDQEIENRWDKLSQRLEAFYQAHEGLRELMNTAGNRGKEA